MTPREKTVEKWGTPLHPTWAKWDLGLWKGLTYQLLWQGQQGSLGHRDLESHRTPWKIGIKLWNWWWGACQLGEEFKEMIVGSIKRVVIIKNVVVLMYWACSYCMASQQSRCWVDVIYTLLSIESQHFELKKFTCFKFLFHFQMHFS